MANDSTIPVQDPTGGVTSRFLDASQTSTTSGTVQRERVVIGDDAAAGGLAQILGIVAPENTQGLTVRITWGDIFLLFQDMLTELKAIRLGMQHFVSTDTEVDLRDSALDLNDEEVTQ